MNQREEIAGRVRGLAESSGKPESLIAEATGLSLDEYRGIASGRLDPPMGWLSRLAAFHGVDMTSLLTGAEPHSHRYHLTRAGTGAVVERRAAYRYEGLASQFAGKAMEPFIVTVEPSEGEPHLNSHPGQEFDMVIAGSLRVRIGGTDLDLFPGDSLYFDSGSPHGMSALGGKSARFLAIITA